MFSRSGGRGTHLLAAVFLAAGALIFTSGCSKKPIVDPLIAAFEVPADKVQGMVENANANGGKSNMLRGWISPEFAVTQARGTHRVKWLIDANMKQTGAVLLRLETDLEDDKGKGIPLLCSLTKPDVAAGAFKHECESAPFRVENDKKMTLSVAISEMRGLEPTQIRMQVLATPPRITWLDWFFAMRYLLLGVVMVVLWWFFFKRNN